MINLRGVTQGSEIPRSLTFCPQYSQVPYIFYPNFLRPLVFLGFLCPLFYTLQQPDYSMQITKITNGAVCRQQLAALPASV